MSDLYSNICEALEQVKEARENEASRELDNVQTCLALAHAWMLKVPASYGKSSQPRGDQHG
jgi:cellobiose-specific phosphotransferase system component IIA